jgi:hypothetical protein
VICAGRQAPSKSPQASLDILPVEALDDFEYRVLGSPNGEGDPVDDDFLRELDEIGRTARGMKNEIEDDLDVAEEEDWIDDKAKVLTDLALSNMEMFDLEDEENPYRMRSDRLFFPGQTYDPEVERPWKLFQFFELEILKFRAKLEILESCRICNTRCLLPILLLERCS